MSYPLLFALGIFFGSAGILRLREPVKGAVITEIKTIYYIHGPGDDIRKEYGEPITSGLAKQAGNEIEHPTGFVRNKQSFIEEDVLVRTEDQETFQVTAIRGGKK